MPNSRHNDMDDELSLPISATPSSPYLPALDLYDLDSTDPYSLATGSTPYESSAPVSSAEVSETSHSHNEALSKASRHVSDTVEQGGGDGYRLHSTPSTPVVRIRNFNAPRPVKKFFGRHVEKLGPRLREGAVGLKHGKNLLVAKAAPPLEETRKSGAKATKWVFDHTKRVSVRLALGGVRLVTGLKSTKPEEEITDLEVPEEDQHDPFEFDMAELEDLPVDVPKLAIKTDEDRLGQKKNHVYFENQKYLRYSAVADQASSKFTRGLAEKYKQGEIKPPLKEVVTSVGPRIHIGFKADIEKQTLTISVIEASSLPGLDVNGFSDPYCLVSLKPDAALAPLRTRTIGKTVNPIWKEVFELSEVPPISTLLRQVLHIEVWDYDQIGADDLIGSIDISMDKYDLIGGTDTWVELRTPKNEEVS